MKTVPLDERARARSEANRHNQRRVPYGRKRAVHDMRHGYIGHALLRPACSLAGLRAVITRAANERCNCCELGGVYNGFGSGELLFLCSESCSCHD